MGWIWRRIKDNYKKVLGVAVGVSGVFYPPLLPLTTSIGGIIFGSDFQHGTDMGTPIGKGAKDLVNEVKAVKSVADVNGRTVGEVADLIKQVQAVLPKNP